MKSGSAPLLYTLIWLLLEQNLCMPCGILCRQALTQCRLDGAVVNEHQGPSLPFHTHKTAVGWQTSDHIINTVVGKS
ncbi:hypothetical protein B0T19DRAFT_211562 [Cercophora scortea]|uniref:Secreted protein n=1 Tax=Cercophora scortea TaxID=314031 RepID=A0AAE0M8W9_9PEZI|nr:hypothetical protein B0T19DRAFT_211562 [Cercophora scortea]